MCSYLKCKQAIRSYRGEQSRAHLGGGRGVSKRLRLLTGNGPQVQVVPDHLLQLVVQGALLELQAEVVTQIRVQHLPCREGGRSGSAWRTGQSALPSNPPLKQAALREAKTELSFQTRSDLTGSFGLLLLARQEVGRERATQEPERDLRHSLQQELGTYCRL